MPMIPLKQVVTIVKPGVDNGWGEYEGGETFGLPCRIEEGTKLTRRTSVGGGNVSIAAEEVVSTAQIYFDKLATISLDDEIYYTDDNGQNRKYTPLSIEVKRAINGKPILTIVNV